jgi:hypothetical protein
VALTPLPPGSVLLQVAFNGYGTWLLYDASRPVCAGGASWDPFDAMLALVWCTWAFIAALLLLLVLTYNLFPDYSGAAPPPMVVQRSCRKLQHVVPAVQQRAAS